MSARYLSLEGPHHLRSGYFSPTSGSGLSSEHASLQALTLFLEWWHLAHRHGEESLLYPTSLEIKEQTVQSHLLAEAALPTMGWAYGRKYLFCRPLSSH